MAKSKNNYAFWHELLSAGLYKRNQGRMTRQLTAVAIGLIIFFGCWSLSQGPLFGYVNSHYEVEVSYAGSVPDENLEDSLGELINKQVDDVLKDRERKEFEQPKKILSDDEITEKYRELTESYKSLWSATAVSSLKKHHMAIAFHFKTTRFWTTDKERLQIMEEISGKFSQAVGTLDKSEVTAEKPIHKVTTAFWITTGIPLLIATLGSWVVYRGVNYPRFADFLISVEAEMDKVSWASWPELYRSTIVVISTMLFLGVTLFVFDVIWQTLFTWLDVLNPG